MIVFVFERPSSSKALIGSAAHDAAQAMENEDGNEEGVVELNKLVPLQMQQLLFPDNLQTNLRQKKNSHRFLGGLRVELIHQFNSRGWIWDQAIRK